MVWRKCSLALWGRKEKEKGGYLGREKRSIGGENLFALVGKGGRGGGDVVVIVGKGMFVADVLTAVEQ